MSSESTEAVTARSPREAQALVTIQRAVGHRAGVLPSARGLSHLGEHAGGWLAAAAAGTVVAAIRGDSAAQARWVQAGLGIFVAHAASVAVKRVVRRPRPHDERIAIGVGTPSKLSFPSSHATSTTAAAVLLGRAAGLPPAVLPLLLVPPMAASRLVLGVHYPTDVVAGAILGAATAAVTTRSERLTSPVTSRVSRVTGASRGER
ncbi:phosphatase PAP2 family protein [Williamsia sp. CHRR-6]|uniref:phosphatase PAP2 family protein n=1 Tax=Williamsia sp. CHRR-6 TaxID=2835871 RepID=UPI001BD965AF|nr:phosphatase PAP2 family protein [Williamsia sp. CHRR-6]MBT0567586.1 phosphatase PAP2 family protein [Williamsia sp. CHRR-6]